ncbi:MAG: isocitrate lyase/phosphoenolpyruvate mutase family protein, partial [Geodermatophilaceae bacterium]|nr:isocitrate lyase/phosphoenolpyruvate mutase family protein [Geodermatophilaceae bacterium]
INVWDGWSARTVAAVRGCQALATASHSIAESRGYPDGERMPVEEMLAAVRVITSATDLPVTADLESGYGDAGATVAAAIQVGAVGANLEDQAGPIDDHVARVAAARAAGTAAGVGFVINARTDEYLKGGKSRARAIDAGRAYIGAGADCIFVPGLTESADIGALAEAFDGRLSVIGSPKTPTLGELARLGVSRVSVGPGSMGVAAAALASAAGALLGRMSYPPTLAFRPPSPT